MLQQYSLILDGEAQGFFVGYGNGQMSPVVHHRPGCPLVLVDTEHEDEKRDKLGKAIQQQSQELIRTDDPRSQDWTGEERQSRGASLEPPLTRTHG